MKKIFEYSAFRLRALPENVPHPHYRFFVVATYCYIVGAMIHGFMAIVFGGLGIGFLSVFNVVSTMVYVMGAFNNLRGKWLQFSFILAMIEIYLFVISTVGYLGWETGFQYYILAVPLYISLVPWGNRVTRALYGSLIAPVYLCLYYYAQSTPPRFEFVPLVRNVFYINNFIGFLLFVLLVGFYHNTAATEAETALTNAHHRSQALLYNILPKSIAERLEANPSTIADSFLNSTILFADIVGFTVFSEKVAPEELVRLLNKIFTEFDQLAEQYGLEKIKTIGDAYMVAAGIPEYREDHAEAMAEMALAMLQTLDRMNTESNKTFRIRIGINSGHIVAGVIGKKKFTYDLWGDSVNTAARMESHGIPGAIQVTEATYNILKNNYLFEERGEIDVKGKGMMKTYFLKGRK